jgi:dipeptidyl aminopeptidase/acylaminoacyl peptidase
MFQQLSAVVALALTWTSLRAEQPPLIPRKVLFSNPARTAPTLSPDSMRVAFIAPAEKGVANIWLETLGKNDAQVVTHDTHRGIFGCVWAADGQHLLYRQDVNGDENWHVYSTDLQTHLVRDLTPFLGTRAQDMLVDVNHPNEILVALNLRDRRVSDMYRIDLTTGALTLDTQNPGDVLSWATDENFVIRGATAFDGETAKTTVRVRDDFKAPWRDLMVVPFEDCPFYGQVSAGTLIAGFASGGRSIYIVYPLEEDKTRLAELDVQTGKVIRIIASDPRSDVEYNVGAVVFRPNVIHDPATGKVQAVAFNYLKQEWQVTDPSVQPDFDLLSQTHAGTLDIVDRVKGDSTWLVRYTVPDGATAYYIYDREHKKTEPLFIDQPELARYTLAPCEPIVIKSRDGLDLVSYLTVPVGVERKNLPLILLPHGGPWWRDRWTYDPWVQLLANRGYAVLQVEYRASTGFGKKFLNAGNRQFGDQAIMGDYLDSVEWAVKSGLADPQRLAVMGASGGGYATLCCIAYHPDMWKCAVDLVGPSSVKTLLESFPPYWKPVKKRWVLRFGDAEHDEEWNKKISPLYAAGNIKAPLLMGYGQNDPRVNIRHAEQLAQTLREHRLPVTLVVYPDEGHGFARPENNLDFFGRMEDFLAQHLGGRKEDWRPVPGSSAQVR